MIDPNDVKNLVLLNEELVNIDDSSYNDAINLSKDIINKNLMKIKHLKIMIYCISLYRFKKHDLYNQFVADLFDVPDANYSFDNDEDLSNFKSQNSDFLSIRNLKNDIDNNETISKLIFDDNIDKLTNIIREEFADSKYNELAPIFLDISALYGSIQCFKYFLLNQGKITARTMKCAIRSGNYEIFKLCESVMKPAFPMQLDAIFCHRFDISFYMAEKYNIDIPVRLVGFNFYCFMHAFEKALNISPIVIYQACSEDIPYLIDLTMSSGKFHGNLQPALYEAIKNGTIDIISKLLEYNVKIDDQALELAQNSTAETMELVTSHRR